MKEKDFTLKEEATIRKFLTRSINCGHATLKNVAAILNVQLPLFSTSVSTADLYNNNKLFFEVFENMIDLAKIAISEIESRKEVRDLENSRENLKIRLQNLYNLEYEEKNQIKKLSKAETKIDIAINELELKEMRKLKKEKREQLELHRMEFQKSLRKRFEI